MTHTELLESSAELLKNIQNGWDCLHPQKIAQEIAELKIKSESPSFWGNQEEAKSVSKHLAALQKKETLWTGLLSDTKSLLELIEMVEENSPELSDLEKEYISTLQKYSKAETDLYLSGEYDDHGAILEITAGAGGTESQDFAEMLLRMELRFAERMGWKTEILEKSDGQEAGIKSVIVEVNGENAFGYLQGEKGTHRLVRQSPFNAKNLRQTSFAGIMVSPLLEATDAEDVSIEEKDIRVDTFRAQGAGGQHVNKTDSAVRITHFPTNIVVTCQNQRSQHQNREKAMQILRSRLVEEKRLEEERKTAAIRGEHVSAEWGTQIRNYVLHPYKLVKDVRTQHETTNPDLVLDGELEEFAKKFLEWKTRKQHRE
ncbi:peptide chain release factor 2 [Candidatus Peregrinibacteria bacterium]|nr:peptide chain release factor 2 [Candidatus Peregrinibacteria bacterium]